MTDLSDDDLSRRSRVEQALSGSSVAGGEPLSRNALEVPVNKRSSRFGLAVIASLILHVAIAWAGIDYASDDVLGGAEIEIETISVEIVGAITKVAASNPTTVAEARSASAEKPELRPEEETNPERKPKPEPPETRDSTTDEPTEDRTAQKTAVENFQKRVVKIDPEEFPRELPQLTDPVDPVPEPQDVARLPVQPEKETVPPEPAATAEDLPVDLPRTAVEPVEAPSKPVRSETRAKAEEANKEQEAKRQRAAKDQKPKRAKIAEKVVKPQRADAKNAEKTTKKASRASTSASNNTAPVQQRVTSASKGALRVFARKIARALARSRPGRITITGTVVVAFTLSSRGTLGSVRVRKSSGSSRVDRAAMRAVRRAKFPGPPKGATRKQRSFVVPYHFCRR